MTWLCRAAALCRQGKHQENLRLSKEFSLGNRGKQRSAREVSAPLGVDRMADLLKCLGRSTFSTSC